MRPCVRGGRRDEARRDRRVLRDQRAHQAALAAGGQRQRFVEAVVGHQRADRAEGLDVVHGVVAQRVARQQQRRREERALGHALAPRREAVALAVAPARRLCISAATRSATSCLLRPARPARPCARPRSDGSPTTILASRARSVSATSSTCWRGTMARRMAVHFWPALTVISRATSLTNRSNSSSSGVTSGARIAQLSESASALNGIEWRTRFGCTRSLAAVSAEPVKVTTSRAVEPVEQVAGAADHQLQAALGQQARLDDQAHRGFGEVAGRGGRLADAGHARQEAGRELLEQAPDREVEGVDVHRDAAARHQDVRAGEAALLAQRDRRAFVHQVARGQLVARRRRHRRTACRCRPRCRSSCRRASRRCGPRSA